MTLQEQIKRDLTVAMKARDEEQKRILRIVLGEFGRGSKKELSDAEVIKVLKQLIKSEREVLERQGATEESAFIRTVASYLPQMATDEEIRNWIATHLDLTQYKNKMQAMGAIMQHFGQAADGKRVKAILQQM
jgi:uncharacterized protein YqeY